MKQDTYQLKRQAYIDQQLSLAETIELEEGLSPTAKVQLERETGFEKALAGRLAEAVPCQDEFWDRLQKQVRAEAAPRPARKIAGLPWLQVAACLAVALILSLSLMAWHDSGGFSSASKAYSVPPARVLATEAEVPGDYAKVSTALYSNGFFLSVNAPAGELAHQVQLLGMKMQHEGKGRAAEVYFECCDVPIIVYVYKSGGGCSMGYMPIDDIPRGYSVGVREVGKYRLVAIGKHDAQAVLDLFL